ncbi:MAG: hypothetical protein PVH18_10570 [Chloroflexota bacterium]|jgi:hypothetical protein
MKENTFTYTARSTADPDKMAMFTLYNGSVSVDLGNTLVEQIGEAYEATGDKEAKKTLATWIKPAATGVVQKLTKPVPLADFDAEMNGEALQATAWIRAGGLRLAPVMMTWQDVDNPDGAQAFVTELENRKASIEDEVTHPAPLDYWISWIVIGVMALALPILIAKQWRKQRAA